MIRIIIILIVSFFILNFFNYGSASETKNFRIECSDDFQQRWAFEYNNDKYPTYFLMGLADKDVDHLGGYQLVKIGYSFFGKEKFLEVNYETGQLSLSVYKHDTYNHEIGNDMKLLRYSFKEKSIDLHTVYLNKDKTQIVDSISKRYNKCISIGLQN